MYLIPLPGHPTRCKLNINGEYRQMNKEELTQALKKAAKEKREKKQDNNDMLNVANVPKPLTPTERAKALQQKATNKWHSYIAKKLLPGLNK